ncbi:hypothetical protein SPRG_19635 [Saprolegnia parasitica CBS 223.65]|uniref:Uncharacterized protein n=1 Tax=Saprolegnia parasitica (strain CBS 223.65) TaxID=695850 RepID=A0A067CUE3_SAPPC|nr:hypothetical protein SPRG_19635 [Saprolegnia parasitica CBS 223.65]KDO30412.1 hypothetical protein SPRG_19635 [Saprolegnia parasitica CBS 223.65]|eukprot:XP_012198866.1 hypothetical protein SPRG_19635 [Saprolegnia parasitica CBS 223.65]
MDDESDVDARLQQTLLKQHENYARQKELLQKLKRQSSDATSLRLSAIRPPTPTPAPVDEPPRLAQTLAESHHEALNDNLRKQLELIRRLEHDNSRLRAEAASLRSQVALLDERAKVKDLDSARRANEFEHASELASSLQRERDDLAQRNTQLKGLLTKAARVKESLEAELRSSLEAQRALHEQVHKLEYDVQQAVLREQSSQHQSQTAESHQIRLHAAIQTLQDELAHAQTSLAHKTEQCTSIQASANACVAQVEASLQAAQESLAKEQEKRRQWESACHTVEDQLETLTARDHTQKVALETLRELRERNAMLEEKVPYYHQLELDNKDMHGRLLHAQRDREEQERNMVQLKQGIWQTTNVLKKEIEAMRLYLLSIENDADGLGVDDVDVAVASWHECPSEIQHLRTMLSHFKHDLVHVSKQLIAGRENERALSDQCSALSQKLGACKADMKDLSREVERQKEACAVAESARDLSIREKRDLLLWSRATCQKTERMASEVEQWEQFTLQQIHRMQRLPWQDASSTTPTLDLQYKTYADLRQSWEASLQTLLQEAHQCHVKANQETHRANKEVKKKLEAVRKLDLTETEMQRKLHEKDVEMQACQLRHTNSMQSLQEQHACLLRENDGQITALTRQFTEATERWTHAEASRHHLEQQLSQLEADAPVYLSIAHLFIVSVRPMVLQIAELQMQKRILSHHMRLLENQHKEIEAIASLFQSTTPVRSLLVRFRAAALAVFACNRFRQTASHSYGRNEALGMVFPQQIGVVKLLALPSETQLRAGVKRLHANTAFADKVATLSQCGLTKRYQHHTSYGQSPVGEALLEAMHTLDPSGVQVVQNVLQGHASFLCDLRPVRHAATHTVAIDVHRIRREVLEWMKKVEQLQFQRNALQKENYALQNAVQDKEYQLKELEVLNANTAELKQKLAMYQTHDGHSITVREFELCVQECKQAEHQVTLLESTIAESKLVIKDLEAQLNATTDRSKTLEEQLNNARHALLEEEDTVLNLKSVIARYEKELKKLQVAAQSVHTQFQQRCSEAEVDKVELNALAAMLHETQRKNESLEAELKVIQHDLLDAKDSPREAMHHRDHHSASYLLVPPVPHAEYKPRRSFHSSAASSISDSAPRQHSRVLEKMHMTDLEDDVKVSMDLEKVNLAVHSYMERIDKKLQSMYGIPESGKWRDYKLQDA